MPETVSKHEISFLDYLFQTKSIDRHLCGHLLSMELTHEQLCEHIILNDLLTESHLKLLQDSFEAYQYVDLLQFKLDSDLMAKIPEKLARMHQVLLLDEKDGCYRLGMSDPTDFSALLLISERTQLPLIPVLVQQSYLERIIALHYRSTLAIDGMTTELAREIRERRPADDEQKDFGMAMGDNLAQDLIHKILLDAHLMNASDVHIELIDECLRIRVRYDGKLQESQLKSPEIANHLIRLIKIQANLDINQNQLPQDGSFEIDLGGEMVNIRVSAVPLERGCSVVMRLLRSKTRFRQLEDLAFESNVSRVIRQNTHNDYGMILISGPTGSGKTTTLYTVLQELCDATKKIFTLEDPVEIALSDINQIDIEADIGYDFADALRAVLRQDPDVIMVGEIRDFESGNIAARAATTGHLVLSTIHTNDCVSVITRFVNLGVDPIILGSALKLVISQRLVPKICSFCVVDDQPLSDDNQQMIDSLIKQYPVLDGASFKKGLGCNHCGQTGYSGRVPLVEYLEIDNHLSDMIEQNNIAAFIAEAKARLKMRTLFACACQFAAEGEITVSDAMSHLMV